MNKLSHMCSLNRWATIEVLTRAVIVVLLLVFPQTLECFRAGTITTSTSTFSQSKLAASISRGSSPLVSTQTKQQIGSIGSLSSFDRQEAHISLPSLTSSLGLSARGNSYDDFKEDDNDEYNNNKYRSSNTPMTTFGSEAVPEDQRPANEYLNLIRQPMFGWADEERGDKGLAIRIALTYLIFFFGVCFPIAGATYTDDTYMIQRVASANVGAAFVILVVLFRIYTGWDFVGNRLESNVIDYEETGWYDGNIQKKTDSEKARDLFLYRSNVKPVIQRLQKALLGAGGFVLASCIALNIATSMNPIFDEYDPTMLKSLVYDEKLADVAAKQSNGKPTYCDNRYYRAVANGGQGCR